MTHEPHTQQYPLTGETEQVTLDGIAAALKRAWVLAGLTPLASGATATTIENYARVLAQGQVTPELAAEMRAWEQQHFGAETALALVSADVDRVQGYVFESAKLPEMRGASLLLDLLNVKADDNLGRLPRPVRGAPQMLMEDFAWPRKCLIYAGGGSLMLFAPRAQAADICRSIERLYVETTLTATITAVYEPVALAELVTGPARPADWPAKARQAQGLARELLRHNLLAVEEWGDKALSDAQAQRRPGFGHWQTALGYKLRRAKQNKATAPLFEVSPYTERCAFCRLRPSHSLSQGADKQPICEACQRKRAFGQDRVATRFYLKEFHDYLQSAAGRDSAYSQGAQTRRWSDIESAPDLEAVASAGQARSNNFVGLIYADGNDMGAALEKLRTPAEFTSFARDVRAAITHAVHSGLSRHLTGPRTGVDDSGENVCFHPFEIISIGGDDVYLYAPADVALELAADICRSFEESFQGRLTLSAGVLLAHVTSPVYFSRQVVKGLLKNAKRRSKAQGPAVSTLDFQVITADSAVGEDIAEFRAKTYRNSFSDEGLTTRPLTLDETARLVCLARDLKARNFPRAQLYALREAVVAGPQPRATNFYYYQQARSREMAQKYQPLHDFLSPPGVDASHLPFWRAGEDWQETDLVTPLVDLLEIYDFIRPAREAQGGMET